jgi:hypothetical protein
MTWILLQLIDWKRSKSLSLIITIGFFFATIKILPFYSRHQDRLDWRQDVSNCLAWDTYVMGVQYTGSARSLWPLPLRKEVCQRAVNNSLLDTSLTETWLKPATEFNIFVAVEMPTVGGPFCPECSLQFQKAPAVQSIGFAEGATPSEFTKPMLDVYGTYGADFQTKHRLVLQYPASSQYLEFAFLTSAPDAQHYVLFETLDSGEHIARYTLPFLSGWHFLRFKIPESYVQQRLRVTLVDEGPAWVSVAIPKSHSEGLRPLPKDLEPKVDL